MNKLLIGLLLLIPAPLFLPWTVAGSLAEPAQSIVELPNVPYDIESVKMDGVHGWYIPAEKHRACILLMHGVRSNRKEMLGRAEFLLQEGYSSLAIDLQAHGETVGEKITYGNKESGSARAATQYLYKKKSCKKVVSIGSSLGGAASLLGERPIDVDGYILEGLYSSIEKAVENRLTRYLGSSGRFLAPAFYMQIPLRLGIGLDSLRPPGSNYTRHRISRKTPYF